MWALLEAREVCILLEAITPSFGYHVALTGGVLYKDGERKDLDILFYRIRQIKYPDLDGLFECMNTLGFVLQDKSNGWCAKFIYKTKPIDIFLPEINKTSKKIKIQTENY